MAIQIKNRQRSKSINLRRIRNGLSCALGRLGIDDAELSILLSGSSGMKSLNSRYRGINRETDVLSFPMGDHPDILSSDSGQPMLGDIAISVPKAVRQAHEYGTTFDEELLRLLIHGLLHLIGYDHEISKYQRLKMEKKERELMDAVSGLD